MRPGGQREGGEAVTQDGEQEVLAGGDGAGMVRDGGGVAGIIGVELADVVGVVPACAPVGVAAGDAAHPPLAQFAPDS